MTTEPRYLYRCPECANVQGEETEPGAHTICTKCGLSLQDCVDLDHPGGDISNEEERARQEGRASLSGPLEDPFTDTPTCEGCGLDMEPLYPWTGNDDGGYTCRTCNTA
jgi:hypothetical protein